MIHHLVPAYFSSTTPAQSDVVFSCRIFRCRNSSTAEVSNMKKKKRDRMISDLCDPADTDGLWVGQRLGAFAQVPKATHSCPTAISCGHRLPTFQVASSQLATGLFCQQIGPLPSRSFYRWCVRDQSQCVLWFGPSTLPSPTIHTSIWQFLMISFTINSPAWPLLKIHWWSPVEFRY